jgi:hypothetical protein
MLSVVGERGENRRDDAVVLAEAAVFWQLTTTNNNQIQFPTLAKAG